MRCDTSATGRRNPSIYRHSLCRGSVYPVTITVALAEQPRGWPFSICAVFLPPSALPPRA
ncbi:hypothetical protein DVA43_11965 [Leclercia sp. W6]|nr:hypothetical protein DVA43_11965 [Leclercia sp. W6]